MNLLNNYDEYILDLIVEDFKSDTAILVLSKELVQVLRAMTNDIASDLLSANGNWSDDGYKITLLDINNKENSDGTKILDSISFMQSNKAYALAAKLLGTTLEPGKIIPNNQHAEFNSMLAKYRYGKSMFDITGRSETSIGRVVKKLFPEKFTDKEVEEFVNLYKSFREDPDFELVNGEDIVKYYNENTYTLAEGSLNNSCMRHNICSKYIQFYANNPDKVSLLIMKNKQDTSKILGRALVWTLDKPSERIFMDRIYTTSNYLENHFKSYAEENLWLYKYSQDMYEDTYLHDPMNNENSFIKLEVLDFNDNKSYPYMDTLKFYTNGVLSNYVIDEDSYDSYRKLNRTDGSHISVGSDIIWSDFYKKDIDLSDNEYERCAFIDDYRFYNDLFYSDFYHANIAKDYAKDNMIECDYYRYDDGDESERLRNPEDTIKLYNGKYSTTDYAKPYNIKYSEYLKGNVFDGIWSKHYNSYLDHSADGNTLFVYIVPNLKGEYETDSEIDWRIDGDGTYYNYHGRLYDNDVKKEDIKE